MHLYMKIINFTDFRANRLITEGVGIYFGMGVYLNEYDIYTVFILIDAHAQIQKHPSF